MHNQPKHCLQDILPPTFLMSGNVNVSGSWIMTHAPPAFICTKKKLSTNYNGHIKSQHMYIPFHSKTNKGARKK